jgi:glutamyl-tRNA(Gln) amidotransferase subunit E
MSQPFDPRVNYVKTRAAVGYVPRQQATQADYDRIGFMSGLEVHQQLLTERKLFCRCPAGIYQEADDYDAELIRHMRPTLSELGEYDGTALMEFKTRKQIVYRIKSRTACTYEVDDTPPFPMDRQALDIAIRLSLLFKLKIVGEVHITRKQYLDGSIPTGFQRTAIIGVEGKIPLGEERKVRVIQLSLEEDSCREVSDIEHVRVYRTDRLGMPLIETVTYPDMRNPDEVRQACDYIRFVCRSTGLVRTGIGAARQDVNVSCRGGTRAEIKGVSHTKWIPELTHNECFRQWSLLSIKKILGERITDPAAWKPSSARVRVRTWELKSPRLREYRDREQTIMAVNLPKFQGALSHFTQPGQCFADEFQGRLKVIACLEKPNMTHSEALEPVIAEEDWRKIRQELKAQDGDAQIVFWGPEDDIKTALETVEERCRMALAGVPNETRKPLEDGTTVFERVLPGADRMYPDTDSKPIPLEESHIARLGQNLPVEVIERYRTLRKWGVPQDCDVYLLKKNLVPLVEAISNETGYSPKRVAVFLAHTVKHHEGRRKPHPDFNYDRVREMFAFIKDQGLDFEILKPMLPVVLEYPKMDLESVLSNIGFVRTTPDEVKSKIPFLREKYFQTRISKQEGAGTRWIMGQIRPVALGNVPLKDLGEIVGQS